MRKPVCAAVTVLVLAWATAALGEAIRLELGRGLERELAPADTQTYAVLARAGQFIFVAVDQVGIDVVVTLTAPGGGILQQIDADMPWELEPLSFTTDCDGEYGVRVRAFDVDADPGPYVITLERQEPLATTPSRKIDQLVAPWSRPGSPGVVVAVVRDGQVLHERGYGLANLEYGVPATPHTVFRLGSMAKQFTALAVAMLAERGDLSFSDDIRTYLPEIPQLGGVISVRNLLDHTSGLREQFDLLALAGYDLDDAVTGDQVLRLMARQRELNSRPGEEYRYCNTGYALLAEIVSRVTGEPFSDWMAVNVFEPLGMTNTRFTDGASEIIPGRAYAYGYGDTGGLVKMDRSFSIYGSGGLYSTCDDLLKWVRNFEDGRVGGRSALERMQQSGTLNDGAAIGYAFGNHVEERDGLRVFSHGGMVGGFMCWMERFPDQRFAVIVLSNMRTLWPDELAGRIAEFYLEAEMDAAEPEEPASEAAGETPGVEETAPESFELRPEQLPEYAGDYFSHEVDSTLRVLVDEGRLFAEDLRHGRISLRPAAEDEFESFLWFLPGVRFERDGRGVITGLRILGSKARSVLFLKQA